jgi:hypothetical protein
MWKVMGGHLNPRSFSEYIGQLLWCQRVRCMNWEYAASEKYLHNSVFTS